ncbi:periplasmic heavy metal sensor [uncultured Draconibacterium sp.]|uniref:Spy/CpxP family protein refolding chaperone n=1 Tax=uncultured Draconibacterium sp. TaxID=1573823 RepID=UPI0032174EFE
MKTRVLSMVLIAVFAISLTTMAQNPKTQKKNLEQKEMMMKHRDGDMNKRFDTFFTEEQQAKVKELRLESAKKIKPLKNELNELQAKQQTLSTADKADLSAINSNIDKMSKVKADIAKIMAKQHQEIRSMLSEEQLMKFDEMKARRGDRKPGFERNERDHNSRSPRGERS